MKTLVLDGVIETDSEQIIFPEMSYFDINKFLIDLKKLEKFEINFSNFDDINNICRIISYIINTNPNIKDLKITIPLLKDEKDKNKENSKENKNN